VVLANPAVAVATKDVFARWATSSAPSPTSEFAGLRKLPTYEALLEFLLMQPNDLERPAIALAPVIADVLAAVSALPGCDLARMSGSGASCFGLFADPSAAVRAGQLLSSKYPRWWVRATTLGGV
jgi:4-diphosphocytidyl-2-C-methyl-D-erythritol kinase